MAGQNKRFLGLGFTFAAEDKGLEKKLTTVRDLFKDIGDLSSKSNKAQKKGKGLTPGVQQVVGHKNEDKKEARKPSAMMAGIRESLPKHEDYAKTASSMASKLTGDTKKSFVMESSRLMGRAIERGLSLKQFESSLKGIAFSFSESEKHASTFTFKFKQVADYMLSWSKDMKDSLLNFLDSIGVNFKELMPKELVAAFGVLRSAVSPLLHGVQKAGGVVKEKVGGMFNKAFETKNAKSLKDISRGIGNSPAKYSVQEYSELIYDQLKANGGKKEGGFLDKIKGFLGKLGTPLAALTGLLGIGTLIKKLGSFLGFGKKAAGVADAAKEIGFLQNIVTKVSQAFMGLWSWIARVTTTIGGWFEAVKDFVGIITRSASPLRTLWGVFEDVAAAVWRFIAPITAVAIALTAAAGFVWGFAEEIPNIAKSIWGFVTSGFSFLTTLGEWVYTMIQPALAPIGQALDFFFIQPLKLAGNIILSVFKMIFEGWKLIGGLLGKGVSSIFEGLSGAADLLTDKMRTSIDATKAERANTQPRLISVPITGNTNLKDVEDMAMHQQITADSNVEQTDLMKEQNRILNSILEKSGNSANPNINVRVDKNGKATVQTDQVTRSIATGVEG